MALLTLRRCRGRGRRRCASAPPPGTPPLPGIPPAVRPPGPEAPTLSCPRASRGGELPLPTTMPMPTPTPTPTRPLKDRSAREYPLRCHRMAMLWRGEGTRLTNAHLGAAMLMVNLTGGAAVSFLLLLVAGGGFGRPQPRA